MNDNTFDEMERLHKKYQGVLNETELPFVLKNSCCNLVAHAHNTMIYLMSNGFDIDFDVQNAAIREIVSAQKALDEIENMILG